MGRGRKPKPPELKVFDRPCRTNYNAPQAKLGKPKPTQTLKGDSLKAFNRLCKFLEELSILAEVDADILTLYAVSYGDMRAAEKTIAKEGTTVSVDTKAGPSLRKHPDLDWIEKNRNRCLKILSEIGLSPTSRSKIISDKDKRLNGFEPRKREA